VKKWQCPECGLEVSHSCAGVNPDANGSAMEAQWSLQAQIAHGFEVLDLNPSTKRARVYNQGYDPLFLEFWNVYPLRRNKRKAAQVWRKALVRASANDIIAGAARYRNDPNRIDGFTKYAEGWLNGDGWLDDPLPVRLRPGVEPSRQIPTPEDVQREIAEFLGG